MKRQVYFISDSTGITAETMGRGLLAQFAPLQFECTTWRYIDTLQKVDEICQQLDRADNELRPVIISTLIKGPLRSRLESANAHVLDLLGPFLTPLEEILGQQATPSVGRTHGQIQVHDYQNRMDAVSFALLSDDGLRADHYARADVILIGPSRTGKTPTCLYLAMQYGLYAANYPLVDEDLQRDSLPEPVQAYRSRLYGLTIRPERLHEIREARRPDSEYASLKQCRLEVQQASHLLDQYRIPGSDVTLLSIEEIATRILGHLNAVP